MTLAEGIGLVTQVFVALGVVANVIQNVMHSWTLNSVHTKIDTVDHKVENVEKKVETVEHATNSMKDDLVTAVRAEAFQAGRLDKEAQDKNG